MPIQMQGNGGVTAEVDDSSTRALRAVLKPLGYGALGHYRAAARFVITNSQAANSRLFEIRNAHASNLLVPTRINIKWLQTGAHTAAIENSLDLYKATGFTAVDSTNTVTPTSIVKRTTGMAAAAQAAVRHVTAAGAAAGMTGGTVTLSATPFAQVPKWMLAAQPTAGPVDPSLFEFFDDVNGTHPFVLDPNEGIVIANRVLLGAAAASSVYVDCSWAEVTAY